MATKDLKQRPGTVKRVADACLAFVELEQAEAVLVRHWMRSTPESTLSLPWGGA